MNFDKHWLCLLTVITACRANEGTESGDTSADSTTRTPTGGESDSEATGEPLDPSLLNCLRVNACEAGGGAPMGLQNCLAYPLDAAWSWATVGPQRVRLDVMACKLAAEDCAGVLACAPALAQYASACAGSFGGDLCQGDAWVFCDELGAPAAVMDCAAAGSKCGQDVWAGCGREACIFGATEASCDGDTLVECSPAGFMVRVDCPTQYNLVRVSGKDSEQVYSIAGETCGYDEMRGALGCVGTGDTCGFFSQRCDGDVLETCAGGKLARRDCAGLAPEGQGCGFVQSGQFAGAAACGLLAGACDLADDERCEDGVIDYCDLGRPASLDCAAAGYGGCAAGALGDRSVAYCTP